MTTAFSRGFGALFTTWQLYAMIATGGLAMFLLQSAMNAGRLVAAQPGLTLTDPIVSILWGILVFHERVRGGLYIILALLSGLTMAGAVIALAGSPLLSDQSGSGENEGRAEDQGRTEDQGPADHQGGAVDQSHDGGQGQAGGRQPRPGTGERPARGRYRGGKP
jgi:hypothetical protein